jgi:hypothetical protein
MMHRAHITTYNAYGSQPYHLHVPTACKFWKPKPPGVLGTSTGLAFLILMVLKYY